MLQFENERLCLVEGSAPMGRMFRENFWTPALRAARLLPDGDPLRLRLLGRDYVAFRGTDGRAAIMDEACPHRGVSLALGRNENNSLRCIFHGWRFDVTGQLLEAPNEHTNVDAFVKRIKANGYPIREAGGVVWVWLGAGAPAEFGELDFMKLPAENVAVYGQPTKANWLQCLEGVIDSSHLGILHKDQIPNFWTAGIHFSETHNAPIFEVDAKPYGIEASALRVLTDGSRYARVTSFVAPYVTFIPPNGDGDRLVHINVIHDDTHTTQLILYYHPDRAPQPQPWYGRFEDPDSFAPLGTTGGYWGQDRAAMRRGESFSGFEHLFSEDLAVQESSGSLVDRTREHLCSGDIAIVRTRRALLKALTEFEEGAQPELARLPVKGFEGVAARCVVVGDGEDWRHIAETL
ncbi:Rieske 2Fe-2S domain-containing protein [soil metagenome]